MRHTEPEGMRYEVKFALNLAEYNDFERWLAAKPFVRRDYPSRTVNSIYFDAPNLASAVDNIIGVPRRSKIRSRYYGNSVDRHDPSTLEAKNRIGRLGYKVRAGLNILVDELVSMPPEVITQTFYQTPVAAFLSRGGIIMPVLYVGYERAYFCGSQDIRVTIDKNLQFIDLLKRPSLEGRRQKWDDKIIVEFKFPPSAKDHAAQIMMDLPSYPTRSSKYIAGLSYFGHVNHI